MAIFVDMDLKYAAPQAMERIKFDVIQDKMAIAFFDTRGFPPEFNAQEALHCYRQQGLKALQDLCFGYACIICDLRHQRVIFSSDNLGLTTFFYYAGSTNIIVSDVLSNIQYRTAALIDQQSFDWYFICGFVPGNKTIYENIYKLSAGKYVIIEKERVSLGTYERIPKNKPIKEEQLKLDLDTSLRSSVKKMLKSPIGVMLSGGFDSSLLCWLIKSYQEEVRTFVIGSSDLNQETLDQSIRMARVLKTQHEVINVTLKEYLAAIPLTVRLMDEPYSDLDTAVIYPALRKIPHEIKYLLHGFGSDQLIGNDFGYLKDLAESMGTFSDFDRYSSRHRDIKTSALFFIKEKMPQDIRLHFRLNPGLRARLVFPFFEQTIVQVSLQMPSDLRSNKKLLRSLAPSLNKILPPNRNRTRFGSVKGQIPEIVKDFTRQVYGRSLTESRLLQGLMGKSRLHSIVSSGKSQDILKLIVFNLWTKEVAGKQEAINYGKYQSA